jgi:serralysin
MCEICSQTRPFDPECPYEALTGQADPGFGIVWNEGFFDGPNGPHGLFSTGIMTVNSTYNGAISYIGDSDWIRIDLQQGQTYTIAMWSNSMETFLGLADNTGAVLATDNFELQTYQGLTYAVSELTVTASRTGTYFIIAEESGVNGTGGYTVGVVEQEVAPGTQDFWTLDEIAFRLTDSGWEFFGGDRRAWDKTTITYNDSAMNPAAAKLVAHAFDAWAKLTGLTFTRTTGNADITLDDEDLGKAYARSELDANGNITSAFINVAKDWDSGTGTLDSYLFQTIVHEIGHALGLAHAGDYNAGQGGPTTYPSSVLYLNDSWNVTIMSYINQGVNTNDNADFALVMTPMIADIIAIQDLYGQPARAYDGNTRYGFNSNTGDYLDLVFDALVNGDFSSNLIAGGQPLSFTLWDTGGRDVVDFRTDTMKQVIDLRAEALSTIYGVRGAMVIGRDTVIEDAVAGSGNDSLFGNNGRNTLDGRGGNDRLEGLDGNDRLLGGGGKDKLLGGAGKDTLDGQDGNDKLTGDAGADAFVFGRGSGKDMVLDFEDDIDTLRLDDALWTGVRTVAQVIADFGTNDNGDVVFDFGGGNVLTVLDITLNRLANDIDIV